MENRNGVQLLQLLRDNLEMIFEKEDTTFGLCEAAIDLKLPEYLNFELVGEPVNAREYNLLAFILKSNLPKVNRIMHKGSLYCWEAKALEPRIEFLNELILKLKSDENEATTLDAS